MRASLSRPPHFCQILTFRQDIPKGYAYPLAKEAAPPGDGG